VAGHCSSADQVLPAAETDHDLVLMNLDLPSDFSSSPHVGFALTQALVERDPNERVLILTDVEDLHEAIETLAAGGECWPD